MSEVNPRDLRVIRGAGDVIETYQGAGKATMAGLEVELAFFDPAAPDNRPMTLPQNKVVKHAAAARLAGDWVRNEPTSETLEVAGIARPYSEAAAVLEDAKAKIKALSDTAAGIGLKRSYFQDLPDRSAAELLANLVDLERYRAFFGPPRADMTGIAAYFAVCKSNQVSISYTDTGHMLDNVRRLYALAPFLFLLTDNSSGFNEGRAHGGHNGMHHRAALGSRGGVPGYLFTAQTGDEYIRAHIDAVLNNPLYVYYDETGALSRLPSGTWTSVNALREHGLNIASNYHLAESVLWPDVKIAALKDESGLVVNHRYEARMFGVGMHQHQSAFLIVTALAYDENFAQRCDHLLARYGFSFADPQAAQAAIHGAYGAAREHGGRFMDIAYGSGRMLDFARDFADLLEASYLGKGFDDALIPALAICRSGCTDGKINRILFPTLEAIAHQQKTYDPAIFDNPDQCAHMVYTRELREQSGKACRVGGY